MVRDRVWSVWIDFRFKIFGLGWGEGVAARKLDEAADGKIDGVIVGGGIDGMI